MSESQLPSKIPFGRYVFERIKQVGVNTIFGVPGDFNLSLLDHIYTVDGLRWAGNANELNAGYSADGYSRINGMSCLVTTFGVGDLSAVNAIAGMMAEHVGCLHIVGTPSLSSISNRLLLHHTLGNGRFDIFEEMSKHITQKTSSIDDIRTAQAVLDDLIETAYTTKRPVYLGLPSNFVDQLVDSERLKTPLKLTLPPNDKLAEDEIVESIFNKIVEAKDPIMLVDACASRHDVQDLVAQFVEATKFPVYTTPMGKSAFSEDHSRFGGVYIGVLSNPDVKEAVESSDLILSVGGLLSDFNTGSFSYNYHTTNVIEFHSDFCKVRAATYADVKMKYVLERLCRKIKEAKLDYVPQPLPESVQDYKKVANIKSGKLTQDYLWKKLSFFLRSGDVLVTETGTSSFGVTQTHFPGNITAISQVLWGSIGYSLPSATGAQFALEEIDPNRRCILFIGDGSLQLTVQSISDICRWNLKPYLFVLNNNGYTIEKLIHGPKAQYNMIQKWDHFKILELFHDKVDYENHRVSTIEELNALFADEAFNKNDKVRLIEIMLDEMDAPENLVKQAKISEQINAA